MQESRNGLSLIEVCISIVIVLIVLVSMLRIFSQGYRYLRKTRTETAAYNLAREVMEEYSDWDSLDILDTNDDDRVDPPGSYLNPRPTDPVTLNSVIYNVTLTTFDIPGFSDDELTHLDVTVTWPGGAITFTTLKADY
jgi:type II secretory pathway pseudopilin PulG